jgi:outer membrane protein TolC
MKILAVLAVGMFAPLVAHAQTHETLLPNAPSVTIDLTNSSATGARAKKPLPPDSLAGDNASPEAGMSLYTVVDLALRNSKAVKVAEADVMRARGALSETRDVYIPNFAVGSGLGYSYGFPLGTPTIFNVTSTSLLLSFSQHDYIRSARAAVKSAALSLENMRRQIILDAALDYIDLNTTLQQIAALNHAVHDSDALISVLQDRLQAGVASRMDVTQAQLTQAQVQVRIFQLQDHADELREHLSNLTGFNADLILPQSSSIPAFPDLDFSSIMEKSGRAPEVEAADATADAKMYAAWGDERQNYRPTVQFAAQYALFSTINNYTVYYVPGSFQANNFGVGIQAIWPLFDPVRHNRALESKAEAERARRQAELARIQNSESDMKLWHSLQELEAQAKVAQLQQQIAQETLATTVTQMNQGSASATAPTITPQQADEGRIQERTTYVDLQDAQFNVARTKLNLLSAVGGLEDWVRQDAQLPAPSRPRK